MNEDEGVDDHDQLLVDLHRALHRPTRVTLSVDENAALRVDDGSQDYNIRKDDWMGMMKAILSSPTLLSVHFRFHGDPILCLSMVHEICQGLSSNHTINRLSFSLGTEVDLSEPLSKLLTANSCCLEDLTLDFWMWNWTLGGVDQLGRALGQNRTLKSLYVGFRSNLGASSERNEKMFGAHGLGSNRTLQELVLDGVKFWRGSRLIEDILRNNPSLQKLGLFGCDFIHWEGVAAALEVNATVVSLALRTFLDDEASIVTMGGDDMFAFLMRNSTLESLELWGSWGPSRIRSLAAVLAKNPPLKTLSVTPYGLGKDVLADLLRALTTNKCLHTFQFGGKSDSFSDDAFDFLKQENPTLRRLQLWGCLDARGLDSLAIALKSDNAALVELDIGHNHFDEKSVLNLLDILRHKKCLETLKLVDCNGVAGDKVFEGIMDMIAANIWLKEVDLRDTPLDCDGSASRIAATLKRNAEVYSEEHLEVLKGMLVSRPKTARIFLCGYPRAGKTTLQRKMQGTVISSQSVTSSKRRIPTCSFGFLKFLRCIGTEDVQQFEIERTRGIEVVTLQWEDISLSVWDMAGHEDFQSFHELVIPDSCGGDNSCVFLLVCNPFWKSEGGTWRQKRPEVIEQELVYWLTFVSSNTMISTVYKPCVQIVFTHKDVVFESDECILRLRNKLDDVQGRFDKVIELYQPFHMVDATCKESLVVVLQALKKKLQGILAQAPSVFDECVQAQRCIDDWIGRHPKEPLVKWDKFVNICESVMTGLTPTTLKF